MDRPLVLSLVRAASAAAAPLPVFVKIRLLDTAEETATLVGELRDAGAAMVAVHARYRASFERDGAGARDGPAMLDQVRDIKRAVGNFPVVSNGNVKTWEDVVENRRFTESDGIMSAEGILVRGPFMPLEGTGVFALSTAH